MMNKLLTKTTKKLTLLCLAMTLIVALAAVFTGVFGVNTAATIGDQTTVTVKMSAVYYRNESKREGVMEVCEKAFEDAKLDVLYVYNSEMTGDECELMYVFDADANAESVAQAKAALETKFADAQYDGAFLAVEQGKETIASAVPTVNIIRAAVAVVAFAALAFVYTWITHGLQNSIAAVLSVVLSCVMTAAIVLLVRIPVTSSILYVCVLAAMLTSALVMIGLNKLRGDESKDNLDEKVVRAIAVKETVVAVAVLGVALVLMGAIATWAVRWFALCGLIGLLVSAAMALFVMPAIQLPLLEKEAKADAERTKHGYVGAKKTEKE